MFKKMLIILMLFFAFFSVANVFANDQGQPSHVQYIAISVRSGDSLWNIASHYNNKNDIREFIYTIRKINGLNNNAEIYPGQILKIPVQN